MMNGEWWMSPEFIIQHSHSSFRFLPFPPLWAGPIMIRLWPLLKSRLCEVLPRIPAVLIRNRSMSIFTSDLPHRGNRGRWMSQ